MSLRGFSVAHQRAAIRIDISDKALSGWTELTIVPTRIDLREILIDARRLKIEKCYINGLDAYFEHQDLLSNPPDAAFGWNVNQHSLYGEKLKSLMRHSGHGPGDLKVSIPESVTITEPIDATFIASHSTKEKTYEPLTLRILYHIRGDVPNEGVHFAIDNLKEAHAYTTHTPISQATSCWLPCVDGLWSLSTWEFEFSLPQLLDESDPESELTVVCNGVNSVEEPDPADSKRKLAKFGMFSPISSQHVGFAVGPFIQIPLNATDEKQVRHDLNVSETANPVSNINSSVAVIDEASLNGGEINGTLLPGSSRGESEQNRTKTVHFQKSKGNEESVSRPSRRIDESQVLPIIALALPSKASLVARSCSTLSKAMDFFTRDFGSFPFDSYSVAFVADFPAQADTTLDACALTICSDTLLFTPDMIEPRFSICETLARGMAAQWCGVNIVPSSANDFWVTEGISRYMTNLFIRKIMGNNEYRFRIKKGNEELCREDTDRPPIGRPRFRFPLSQDDLRFIRLKAPLVLYILDRRMTKTDRSLGVSRVLTKLFLQSMSGDLRSQLSTAHFVRQCEKVAHHRLSKFFDEWVFGSGFPIFRITQRFNKKRLCIEMGIGQVHSRELPPVALNDESFLDRAMTHLDIASNEVPASQEDLENLKLLNELSGGFEEGSDNALPDFAPPPSFTGPMTIRIHEANGTPYEHVVELRDQLTKIDIPYNTKYKRLRRNQKFRKATTGKEQNGLSNEQGDGLINCLGDVLMSDAEIADWLFVDWGDGGEEEEGMFNEAFEWLRADADFEWLGRFFVSQPDYMYASQLQQDRDIVAQFDAVTFYGRQQPNPIYCTVLTRTIMDPRYFYGIRVAAIYELAKLAVPQVQHAGLHLLLRIFRELFCFKSSRLPRANNFSDLAAYFVQKAIPQALSRVRDQTTGRCPTEVCSFILDLIRYNENSENPYSDTYFMVNLLESAANTLRPINGDTGEFAVRGNLTMFDNDEFCQYVIDVVGEIDKCQRLDRWVPSHERIITTAAMKMEELLVLAGYGEPRMDKLLMAAHPDEPPYVRAAAISSILRLGGYRNPTTMKFVTEVFLRESSARVHIGVLDTLKRLLGHVAVSGEYSEDVDVRKLRQVALARKTVQTAIPLLRETLGEIAPLREAIWKALISSRIGSYDKRILLEICQTLFPPEARLVARMKVPNIFILSMKRKREYVMVAKYRSILRKTKSSDEGSDALTASAGNLLSNDRPKLRLKLR